MRMLVVRVPRVLVTAIALLCIGVAGLGATPHGPQRGGLEALCYRLGLTDVAAVPQGIEPLVVDTPEQLREVVMQVRAALGRSLAVDAVPREDDTVIRSLGLVETYKSFHYSMNVNPLLGTRFNLWAHVWLAGSGSFWEITDAYEWIGLTGISYCHGLSSEWHYHRIASDRRSITVAGGAMLDTYLIVKGVFKIYSEPVAISFTYRL